MKFFVRNTLVLSACLTTGQTRGSQSGEAPGLLLSAWHLIRSNPHVSALIGLGGLFTLWYHSSASFRAGLRIIFGWDKETCSREASYACPFLNCHSDEVIDGYARQCPFLREEMPWLFYDENGHKNGDSEEEDEDEDYDDEEEYEEEEEEGDDEGWR